MKKGIALSARLLANEQGFVLVASLLILLILVIIGVAANTTTTLELQIAANEKVHKQTFFEADGGSELGTRLVEENVSCPDGFAATGDEDNDGEDEDAAIGIVVVDNLTFAEPGNSPGDPDDTNRDVFMPINYANAPHTNMTIGGDTMTTPGSGLQMISGYEGMGKAAAAGGGNILYDINSQRVGPISSESLVALQWRHVIGLEGECQY